MEHHDDVETRKKLSWRMIISRIFITSLLGGLVIASAFPTLYGSLRIPTNINSFAYSLVSTCNMTCTDYTGDVIFLQQQLKSSRDEVQILSALVNELKIQVKTEPASPICDNIQHMEFNNTEITTRQEALHEVMLDLLAAIEQRKIESATLLQEHSSNRQKLYDNLLNSMQSLSGEVHSLQEVLMNKTNEANILSTISEMSLTVAQAFSSLHEQQTLERNELFSNITSMKKTADSFTCPDPIIPVIVEPVVFRNCTLLPSTDTGTPVAIAHTHNVSESTIQRRECVNMSAAQTIVASMVNTELEILSQNLTHYCDKSHSTAVAEFHRIATDKVESALEAFNTETARLHAEQAEYLTETVSRDCLNILNNNTTTIDPNNLKSIQITNEKEIPELDYALIASGSRVIADQTSKTYFPKQWHLETRLKDSLSWLGVSVDDHISATRSGSPASAVGEALSALKLGSGKAIYEGLNLHKTVGVPEDALRVEKAQGSSNCWPMEGSQGNLTVQLAGAVIIQSVTIDHLPGRNSASRKSAPRRFEVYGVDAAIGSERLLIKDLFNGTAGAPYAQNFPVLDQSHSLSDKPFDRVRLRVLSNHGHSEYTCIYRFRVHGVPLP